VTPSLTPTITNTPTITPSPSGPFYNLLRCCTNETLVGYLDRNIDGADVPLAIGTRITVDDENCFNWIVEGWSNNIVGYVYVFGIITGANGCTDPTPTRTPTPSVTPSISITPTITPSISTTPAPTPAISLTPMGTPEITSTPSYTPSLTPIFTWEVSVGYTAYGACANTDCIYTFTVTSNDYTLCSCNVLTISSEDRSNFNACFGSTYGAEFYIYREDERPLGPKVRKMKLGDFPNWWDLVPVTNESCQDCPPPPSTTPTISITPTRTPTLSVTPTITPTITPTRTPSITPSVTPASDCVQYVNLNVTEGGDVQYLDCYGNTQSELVSVNSNYLLGFSSEFCINRTSITNLSANFTITGFGPNCIPVSITPTKTPTLTPTITPSLTPTRTATPSLTPTRTATPSVTPSRTATLPPASVTPTRTATPSLTPTTTACVPNQGEEGFACDPAGQNPGYYSTLVNCDGSIQYTFIQPFCP
jgi:hypothetical protein